MKARKGDPALWELSYNPDQIDDRIATRGSFNTAFGSGHVTGYKFDFLQIRRSGTMYEKPESMPSGQQLSAEMPADEAGATTDENLHTSS